MTTIAEARTLHAALATVLPPDDARVSALDVALRTNDEELVAAAHSFALRHVPPETTALVKVKTGLLAELAEVVPTFVLEVDVPPIPSSATTPGERHRALEGNVRTSQRYALLPRTARPIGARVIFPSGFDPRVVEAAMHSIANFNPTGDREAAKAAALAAATSTPTKR
jgi:hypothetical protein